MSFRRNRRKLKIIFLGKDIETHTVVPKKGVFTLYYWYKEASNIYKGDLYYCPDGDLVECGIIGDSLQELKSIIYQDYPKIVSS